jgi:hypothetical protein
MGLQLEISRPISSFAGKFAVDVPEAGDATFREFNGNVLIWVKFRARAVFPMMQSEQASAI